MYVLRPSQKKTVWIKTADWRKELEHSDIAGLFNNCLPVVFQEQYQFLYKAMLSLIGTQEDKKTLQSSDNNGTIVVGTASTAESLESLV